MTETQGDLFVQQQLQREANSRTKRHNKHTSQRKLTENHDFIGLTGEWAFGEFVGLMPDFKGRLSGDKGIDFMLPGDSKVCPLSVDVKTSRRGDKLLHEKGKGFADIYVLAHYDESTKTAKLVGWEWGSKLRDVEPRDTGCGVINHEIPVYKLHPMANFPWRYTYRPK